MFSSLLYSALAGACKNSIAWERTDRQIGGEKVDKEKLEWLKSIGAGEFPEPIKYIYTFSGYNGAFNLSERYVEETPLLELKAQYEKNRDYVDGIIKAEKSRGDFLRGAEPL